MVAKFDFFERVTIYPKDRYMLNKKKKFTNSVGTVLAKGLEANGEWAYDVSIDEDDGKVWGFKENELESLGTFAKREDYYSGESIRVGVTKEGEGYIIEDKKNER